MTADFSTIGGLQELARERLAGHLWDFAGSGAGEGATRRRSRLGFDSLTFRPRLLRGVGVPDTRVDVAGHTLGSPVFFAPVGSIARYHPDGALNVAAAVGPAATIGFIGGLALPALEDVAAAATGPLIYQVYVAGDRAWLAELMARVEEAGFSGLCITADSVAPSFSDRLREAGWSPTTRPDHPNLLGASDSDVTAHMSRFDWDDLAWLRSRTDLPLLLKGVLTAEDAVLAVEHGVDVVYVSNHGGLVLDHGPAVTEVLGPIVDRVSGRAQIVADGGILRGTDVVKLVAIGAAAVGIGRLTCWAVAAGGAAALVRTAEILTDERRTTMAMVGAAGT
ncbi:MAG: alpha-hydroxy acid oxidase, partial [Acidimicrobiia bacterium]|nr:alpha-hydroxy acid oxidase [Acidimicrobiia bacterium]